MWLLAIETLEMASKGAEVGRLAIFSNWLEKASTSPWFYAVIFAVALLDSVFPIVPSETAVILGGIAAGQRKLLLPAVIVMGATGAFCGDNIAYGIGSRFGGFIERRSNRTEKGRKRLELGQDPAPKTRRVAARDRPIHSGRSHDRDLGVGYHGPTQTTLPTLRRPRFRDLGHLCRGARFCIRRPI
jgi:hypothetical protein